MAIEIFVDVGYTLYHVSIFKNMSVAANGPRPFSDIEPRASLAKIVRDHPWMKLFKATDIAERILHTYLGM